MRKYIPEGKLLKFIDIKRLPFVMLPSIIVQTFCPIDVHINNCVLPVSITSNSMSHLSLEGFGRTNINSIFPIEFTPNGRFSAPPVRRRVSTIIGARSTSRFYRSGIKYIIQCPYCNKTFRRTKRDLQLRKHNQPNSKIKCPGSGRRGYLIDTRYG